MKRFGKTAISAALLAVTMSSSLSALAQGTGGSDPQQDGGTQPTPANPPAGAQPTTDGQAPPNQNQPAVDEQAAKQPEKTVATPPAPPKPLLWRGTTLSADQSVSSETAGIGKDIQSSNPSYQLWLSFRPRVYLLSESLPKGHSLNVNARIDMYKELTNSDDTTKQRENFFGDIWVTGAYSFRLHDNKKYPTSLGFGPRVLLPTSVSSRNGGTYITAGGGVSLGQGIHLREGDYFSEAHVAAIGYYTHPFTKATTAVYDDLGRDRIQTDGRTGRDNQLSGGYLVNHQLLSIFDAGLQISPKAGFSLDLIFLHQWRHNATSSGCVDVYTQTGRECVKSAEKNGDPNTLRVSAFPVVSFDYQVLDELNLALGYYNFANTLGPDGQRRNILFAPESSRFFLTATLSLDVLYKTILGAEGGEGAAVQGRLSSRQQMLQNITSF